MVQATGGHSVRHGQDVTDMWASTNNEGKARRKDTAWKT